MSVVEVRRGSGAVVLGLPHTGTDIPAPIWDRLNETGRARADTDWHVERLYDGLLDGATTVRATRHRYVIDVNRGPDGATLYPGQNTTALCPVTDFDGAPIYAPGAEPGPEEIAERVVASHAPYHAALSAELERVRAKHGFALLWDCHSIRSRIPFLFDGLLPDLNFGTNDGRSAAPELEAAVMARAGTAPRYTSVLNGRFKGGWTTRHYGRPGDAIHAIQLELAQSTHLATEAAPFAYDPAKAADLRPVLAGLLTAIDRTARELFA